VVIRTAASREAATRSPSESRLPVDEFVHPVPLAALALLIVNDHYLKTLELPVWLVGKLSDVAGVIFFPLLLTAVWDTLAFFFNRAAALLGARIRVDEQLRRWKLFAACAVTAVCLGSIQLFAPAVELYTGLVGALGFPSVVDMDPTDLLALLLLPIPYLIGRQRIAVRERRG
jgi:hypothetical protein